MSKVKEIRNAYKAAFVSWRAQHSKTLSQRHVPSNYSTFVRYCTPAAATFQLEKDSEIPCSCKWNVKKFFRTRNIHITMTNFYSQLPNEGMPSENEKKKENVKEDIEGEEQDEQGIVLQYLGLN